MAFLSITSAIAGHEAEASRSTAPDILFCSEQPRPTWKSFATSTTRWISNSTFRKIESHSFSNIGPDFRAPIRSLCGFTTFRFKSPSAFAIAIRHRDARCLEGITTMIAKVFNYEERLRQAVGSFWRGRQSAASENRQTGHEDRGHNGARHLDGFRDMIAEVTRQYGPRGCKVLREENLLPGTLRQTNPWDMVIVFQNRLLAAIELKSLCGPSFGIDRLCEEAISSGYEFRKAQGAALFGQGASPFLGYFILVEDSPGSREAVRVQSLHFPTDKIFHSSSYQQRMKILCERMVEQQLYSCASVLVAPNESKSCDSSHLSNQTAFRFLLSRLAGHLASETDFGGASRKRVKDEPAICDSGSLLAGDWFTSIESPAGIPSNFSSASK